jgi:hypothetical protein
MELDCLTLARGTPICAVGRSAGVPLPGNSIAQDGGSNRWLNIPV